MGRLNNDAAYLEKIRDYFAEHRSLPSYSELGKLLGFKAKNAAFKLAARLSKNGFLGTGPTGRLVPGPRFFSLPWVGDLVPAGPTETGEPSGAVEFYDLESLLVDRASETVLVTIRGDSMIDAGVLDGDVAIVRKTAIAAAGDFVVAIVDGGYTLKELRYQRGQPVLVPHNQRHSNIIPRTDLILLGVVTGIIRRYETGRSRIRARPQRK